MTHLVRPELRVIELPDAVLHVFVAQELNNTGAVFVDVSVAYIPCLAHVILQVLPTTRRRKTCANTLHCQYQNIYIVMGYALRLHALFIYIAIT